MPRFLITEKGASSPKIGRAVQNYSPLLLRRAVERTGAASSDVAMTPKYHHPPLSGGDRKALTKEIAKSRAMTTVFAVRSAELREQGEALIREADNLACQSWNERMWSDGGPIDPSPTVDQAEATHGWRSHARAARRSAT
jgi:hypothetical protein